ncbi:MAG: DedA family protein [Ilumatobacteraceae bacterium]
MSYLDDLFNWLKDFSSSPWFYAILFVIAFVDSVLPIVPSETLVIIGGVSAGSGSLSIFAVIACAAAGAFIGDNMSYLIGTRASTFITRRYSRTDKGKRRLGQAIHQIHERGGLLLITARFIPGGRTLLTLSCGVTRQSRPWFVRWTIIAAVIWANYAALLGFIGGKTFSNNHTLAFMVAFGCAIGVSVVIEVIRFLLRLRRNATKRTTNGTGTASQS